MTVRSGWLLNPGQTRADTRAVPLGTFAPASATTTQSGVIPGGTPLALSGSGMTATIGIGRAIAQGTAAQGAYPLAVTAAHSVPISNGHASLPRIDRIFIVAYDSAYDSSGLTQPDIVVVPGTPASSPVAPTIVPNCQAYLALWDVRVEAGSSSGSPIDWATKVTDRRVYTAALGGIVPNGSAAGVYAGQWRDGGGTAGILERYNGTAWESAIRLGTAGRLELGDVSLTRTGTAAATLTGGLTVTGGLSVTGVGGMLTAIKPSNTVITSNITLGVDPHLTLALAANATYLIDGYLDYDGVFNGGGLAGDWNIPAGATMRWGLIGNVVSDTTQKLTTNTTPPGTSLAVGTYGTGGLHNSASPRGYITTTTAGSLTFKWAQSVASSTSTTLYAGSWIRAHRIA